MNYFLTHFVSYYTHRHVNYHEITFLLLGHLRCASSATFLALFVNLDGASSFSTAYLVAETLRYVAAWCLS